MTTDQKDPISDITPKVAIAVMETTFETLEKIMESHDDPSLRPYFMAIDGMMVGIATIVSGIVHSTLRESPDIPREEFIADMLSQMEIHKKTLDRVLLGLLESHDDTVLRDLLEKSVNSAPAN